MRQVQAEAAKARPVLEAGEGKLVRRDCRETDEGNGECVTMEDGDTGECQPEQNEIDRDAE